MILCRYLTTTFLLVFTFSVWAAPTLIVKHYQQHLRYEFGYKLLDLALGKLDIPYDIQSPDSQQVNEARGEIQVIAGQLDVQWLSTSQSREENMIPIKIAVYRGLLGLRLLLVNKDSHRKFSKITTVNELRNYTAGHGSHWGDLAVYPANDLKVKNYVDYQSLFSQLKYGRFDYFHRGLNEIWKELTNHKDTLAVADNIALFYPYPVYFFVTKHKPLLAKQIERGLQISLKDGSFKTLFMNYHRDDLDKSKLKKRTILFLKNPIVPDKFPKLDTSWWLPKLKGNKD